MTADPLPRAERLVLVRRMSKRRTPIAEIAAAAGVTRRTIERDRRDLGLPRWWNPLTDEQVARAKHLLDGGASYNEVARTVGCSMDAIQSRWPGRGWTREQSAEYRSVLHQARRLGAA